MPTLAAAAIVSAIGMTGVAATIATAVIGAGLSFGLNSLAGSLLGGGKKKSGTEMRDRTALVRSSIEPRRIVYGRVKVSGPLVYALSQNGPGGSKNEYLSLVVALAGHEVQEVESLYINETNVVGTLQAWDTGITEGQWVVPPPFPNPAAASSLVDFGKRSTDPATAGAFLQWRNYLGSADQAADDHLIAPSDGGWTAAHRLRGVAYLHVLLRYSADIWAGGLPNIAAVVKGRKVYDPRTGLTAYSDNPALCLRDYLVSDFGLACLAEEIDEASFIAAANVCDEAVPLASGGTQTRYTLGGVVALDEKPIDVVEKILTACAGSMVYSNGQYRMFAGAYRSPTVSLDESSLRGGVKVRPRASRSDLFNRVRGTFIDPAKGWTAADFPPVENSLYESQDGGEQISKEIELPFTSDAVAAQRIAKIILEKSRQSIIVELPCNMLALPVAVMEPVRLSLTSMGWVDKVFLPTSWTLSDDGGIDLTLMEEAAASYDWAAGEATTIDPAPDTNLPNPFALEPPGLILSDDLVLQSGRVLNRLLATLVTPSDALARGFEVQWREVGATDWTPVAASAGVVQILGVRDGVSYEVRARTVNAMGGGSEWTSRTRQVVGQTAPPDDVTGLLLNITGDAAHLSWDAVGDLDLSHYRVRWSALTAAAGWSDAVDVAARVNGTSLTTPARVGTYLVKAVDQTGHESVNAASLVTTIPSVSGFNAVATVTEHSGFAGAKSGVVVNGSSQLILDSAVAFDSGAGNFDSGSGDFDGVFDVVGEGIYNFAGTVDLTEVYVSRVTAMLRVSTIDGGTDFDPTLGDFDDAQGQFDGIAPSLVDVIVELRTTEDNPAGSPTWSSWQRLVAGDYKARAFEFRAHLITQVATATPAVEELAVTIDMPDRTASDRNLTSSAGGTSITFSPAFKGVPAIGITGNDLSTGDYAVVSAASRTGFTVQFKNAAGTGVARNFDWMARGYGRQQ